MPLWLANLLAFILAVAAMEGVAYATHRWVMHGWGWGWHRSHHEKREGRFERNDLYAVVFALPSIALIAHGAQSGTWTLGLGFGVAAYGLIYALFHDGLVHARFGRWKVPDNAYLRRIVQAHRLHHAVHSQHGCVSFGFLVAPPPAALKGRLDRDALRQRPEPDRAPAAPEPGDGSETKPSGGAGRSGA